MIVPPGLDARSEAKPKELKEYLLPNGQSPFGNWLISLKDAKTRARIRVRLDRLKAGNLGDSKSVDGGVQELRMDFGPGYRVYFGQDGDSLVLLLCGGTKRTQRSNIELAHEYWRDYKRRSA